MSQEEHNEWPTFESVFHKIAPESRTARERLSEQNSLNEAEIEAALEPLPVIVHPVGTETLDHEEYEAVDHATSDAIITVFESEVLAPDDTVLEHVTPDEPGLADSYEDDDAGWVSHAYPEIVATEPTVESTAPLNPQIDQASVIASPSMDFSAVVEPSEEPLSPIPLSEPEYIDPELELIDPEQLVETPPIVQAAPDAETAELVQPVEQIESHGFEQPAEPVVPQEAPAAPRAPAPVIDEPQPGFVDAKEQPSDPSEGVENLRSKDKSGKITFWEGRPKFFGGDERRKARARRDSRFARDETPAPGSVDPNSVNPSGANPDSAYRAWDYPAELPQDIPCPSCGHLNIADLRDPQDGTLHIRCDLCGHIWSVPGR